MKSKSIRKQKTFAKTWNFKVNRRMDRNEKIYIRRSLIVGPKKTRTRTIRQKLSPFLIKKYTKVREAEIKKNRVEESEQVHFFKFAADK